MDRTVKKSDLFLTFLKIGATTIGGGFAMLPLIHREIVEKKQWLPEEKFLHFLALAQSSPGVMVVNLSLAIGWELNGLRGAILGLAGATLPSFISILLIALFFLPYFESSFMKSFFKGAVPAVSGVIAGIVFVLVRKNVKSFFGVSMLLLCVITLVFGILTPFQLIIANLMVSIVLTGRRS